MSSYSGESRHNHHWVAHRLHHVCLCVLETEGEKVHATHTNTYKQSHAGREECYPHSMCKLKLRYSVHPNILALRGVSRSTGDETRQPADFNRVASLSLSPRVSLFLRVLAQSPWGAVSARVVGGCAYRRVGAALPTVGDPTSHFGGLAGTMWPVSEGGAKGGEMEGKRTQGVSKCSSSTVTIYTAPGDSLRVRVS